MLQPTSIEEVQEAVRANSRLIVCGGGSKPALSTASEGQVVLNTSRLSGILEYNPSEYTFTALAGTPLAEINAALAQHGQYLPFDPPFVEQGATLGGAVASGLNGPGRYRYGGVRDFILGIKLVDGNGQAVRGGGKVVKNAAGFDTPKLMVGSLGMFGVLVELSFKVFPKPPARTTVVHTVSPLAQALKVLTQLYTSRLDIDALEFEPGADGLTFFVRLRGLPEGLPARAKHILSLLGGGQTYASESEIDWWSAFKSSTDSAKAASLVKIPLTIQNIPAIEEHLAEGASVRHYSSGGNLLWLRTFKDLDSLDATLKTLNLSGLVITGGAGRPRLGHIRTDEAFERRIKQVFDPLARFPTY